MNIPMNHPLAMIMQGMQRGGNPLQLMQQMGNNPIVSQGMRMVQGKSPQQLQQMAENMARERGIDLNQLINSLPIPRK